MHPWPEKMLKTLCVTELNWHLVRQDGNCCDREVPGFLTGAGHGKTPIQQKHFTSTIRNCRTAPVWWRRGSPGARQEEKKRGHCATKQPFILIEKAAHGWAIEKLAGSHHLPLLGKVKTDGQSCGFCASSGGSLKWQLKPWDSHLTVQRMYT